MQGVQKLRYRAFEGLGRVELGQFDVCDWVVTAADIGLDILGAVLGLAKVDFGKSADCGTPMLAADLPELETDLSRSFDGSAFDRDLPRWLCWRRRWLGTDHRAVSSGQDWSASVVFCSTLVVSHKTGGDNRRIVWCGLRRNVVAIRRTAAGFATHCHRISQRHF
jgi:hypothetical protein